MLPPRAMLEQPGREQLQWASLASTYLLQPIRPYSHLPHNTQQRRRERYSSNLPPITSPHHEPTHARLTSHSSSSSAPHKTNPHSQQHQKHKSNPIPTHPPTYHPRAIVLEKSPLRTRNVPHQTPHLLQAGFPLPHDLRGLRLVSHVRLRPGQGGSAPLRGGQGPSLVLCCLSVALSAGVGIMCGFWEGGRYGNGRGGVVVVGFWG